MTVKMVRSDHLGDEELLCCLLLCRLGSGEGDLLLGDLVLRRRGESEGDLWSQDIADTLLSPVSPDFTCVSWERLGSSPASVSWASSQERAWLGGAPGP